MNKDNYPVYILPDGTKRDSGKSAQKMNILAAKIVAETVRSTLGPKGMDKMLVDELGNIIVTNDGVTILRELNVDHPSAKMIIEIAKTQEEEVGDGTTTAVVLAGELLKKAELLLDENVHASVIIKGYRLAEKKTLSLLQELSKPVKKDDFDLLRMVIETAMTGKGAEDSKEHLAGLILEAVSSLHKENLILSRDDIKIEKKTGASINDSELIKGIIVDKEKVHSDMPSSIKNASVALIDSALELRVPEGDAKISISDPKMMQSFVDAEEESIKRMVDKLSSLGVNAVFCQKGIDDLAQYLLAKRNIYALRRVKRSDLALLSKATGAKIIGNLNDLEKKDLGKAGLVEQIKVGEDNVTYVRDCENPKALTILVRGSTPHVVNEVARALEDALGDVESILKFGKAVSGAGSIEIELSKELKKYAYTLKGREQLAVLSFAESFEIIPKTLAENSGLDSVNVLAELKASHDQNNKDSGVDVYTGKIINAWSYGVIEPLQIKIQAVSSASEVAIMILRIDDVILSGTKEKSKQPDLEDL